VVEYSLGLAPPEQGDPRVDGAMQIRGNEGTLPTPSAPPNATLGLGADHLRLGARAVVAAHPLAQVAACHSGSVACACGGGRGFARIGMRPAGVGDGRFDEPSTWSFIREHGYLAHLPTSSREADKWIGRVGIKDAGKACD
jgi:hypothetical protein